MTGAIYFIAALKRGFNLNFILPLLDISSEAEFIPHMRPTRMHIKNPPMGITILSAAKFNSSKKFILNIVISERTPNESEAKMHKRNAAPPAIKEEAFLESPVLSEKYDTMTSSSEIEEVTAAKSNRRKKIADINCQNFMFENTTGSV